jgi:UDP-N-acetyl-D-galactosamine dehydrogenase
MILAGRRLNDDMGRYVASQTVKLMLNKEIKVKDSAVLVLGFTFKENCPDVRNTKVIDIVNELKTYGINVKIFDPYVNQKDISKNHDISLYNEMPLNFKFDAIILAVGHKQFKDLDLSQHLNINNVVFDVKGILDLDKIDGRL